jgi:protein phosphatase
MLTVSTLSHPGAVRPANEDAVLWDAGVGLLAVADGMGGHNAGEVASRLAIETLQAEVRATAGVPRIAWTFGYDSSLSHTANRLLTAVREANQRVFLSSRRPLPRSWIIHRMVPSGVRKATAWVGQLIPNS